MTSESRRLLVVWEITPDPVRVQLDTLAELDARGLAAAILPGGSIADPDPILVAGAASRRSPTIGLVPSFSPWVQPPFHTARALATLDALTGGRAGWFVRTGAPRFSSTDDTPRWNASVVTDPDELDDAAADYLDATAALWNSWEPGALIADVAAGQYVDPSKVHVTDYHGPYFDVRGPLNVPRSPQGRPPIIADHASRSIRGRADVVVVDCETDVTAARDAAVTVLLRLATSAAANPAPSSADGYLISGISPRAHGALYGHVVHDVLPSMLGAGGAAPRKNQLLRDRLRLPSDQFDWTPSIAFESTSMKGRR